MKGMEMKVYKTMYTAPCDEYGYIVQFKGGTAGLIVAEQGYKCEMPFTCSECPSRMHCPLMDWEFDFEQHVCGLNEANALIEKLELMDTLNQLMETLNQH